MSSGTNGDGELGSSAGIALREMDIDDLSPVYRLGKCLFTKTAFPVLYRTWDPYEVTHYFHTDPEFCLVAETTDGDLAGFALGSTVDKDDASWRYGYLAWLGVKPEYQGHHVAGRLLSEFERRMKEQGVRMLLVDTEGDNTQALRFFQGRGFNHPTTHVWLTKSLSRRGAGRAPKPMDGAEVPQQKRDAAGKRARRAKDRHPLVLAGASGASNE